MSTARAIRKNPLEIYIKGYLKTRRIKFKMNLDILRKASVLIGEKITNTCCTQPTAVVNLFTNEEDGFTRGLRAILSVTPLRTNKQSLIRAKKLIDDYIASPCCIAKTMTTVLTGPTGTIELASAGTGGTYVANVTAVPTGPYAIEAVSAQIFINGVAGAVDILKPFTFTFNTVVPALGAAAAKSYYVIITYRGGETVQSATNTFTAQDLS